MKRILIALGTRPEVIKMSKVIEELKKRECFDVWVVSTGQHRDMLERELDELSLKPDIDLEIMSVGQTLFEVTERVVSGMRTVIEKLKPDIVLVHGDTASAFASALAAFYLGVPIGHIEAGLRTYDVRNPFPEEFYRRAIAPIAEYHFAPTAAAADNLLREGIPKERIYVTGNTVIDALKSNLRDDFSHPLLDTENGMRTVIFTAHRRESIGEPLRGMLRATVRVLREVQRVRVIYPLHKNPAVAECVESELRGCDKVLVTEPIGSAVFHNLMARCYMILTDSGGIQEEAAYLGKPTLVMRKTTERKEVLSKGCVKVVGTDENSIYESFKMLLENEELYKKTAVPSDTFGDGTASIRIADALEK